MDAAAPSPPLPWYSRAFAFAAGGAFLFLAYPMLGGRGEAAFGVGPRYPVEGLPAYADGLSLAAFALYLFFLGYRGREAPRWGAVLVGAACLVHLGVYLYASP